MNTIDRHRESQLIKLGATMDKISRYEWVLKSIRKNHRTNYTTIPAIQRMDRVFFNQIFLANSMALVLKDSLVTNMAWSMESLKEHLPDIQIEILNHREKYAEPDKHKEELRTIIMLHKYIDDILSIENTNDFYSAPFNKNQFAFKPLIDDIQEISVLKTITEDNTFIWLGPAGTITPFHFDLQNILMGQLIGRKRILLIPSWDFPFVNNDYKTFANIPYKEATKRAITLDEPQIFEVFLEQGDCIFVPPGWSHYVEGLTASLTLSFTGFDMDNNFYSFFK